MDRKKIIKALEKCVLSDDCRPCEYWMKFDDTGCQIMKDALVLLKEQQQRIETLEIERDILIKDINTNNCNTCKRQCEHRPELGEVVRVNCFMWKGR